MRCNFVIAIAIQLVLHGAVETANVLFLSGVPSPSHHIWNRSIMEALAERGHNLTVLTVEIEQSYENLTFILMENVYEAIGENWLSQYDNGIKTDKSPIVRVGIQNPLLTTKEMYDFASFVSHELVKTDGIEKLLNYPERFHFDVIIHDFSLGPILLGFVDYFGNPPLISISAFGNPPHSSTVTGGHNFPSVSPYVATTFTTEMIFVDRAKNLFYHLFDWFYRRYVLMAKENKIANRLFGRRNNVLPVRLEEIEQRTALTLINVDWALDYTENLPPNVIPVGGLQIHRTEIINPVVQDIMNRNVGNRAMVLFSLGTNMQSEHLQPANLNKFVEAFERLPQYDFLWKISIEPDRLLPSNVFAVDWIQQNAVLSHRNLKLFITHGGLLSVQEASWHCVPMLGVPLLMDQHLNIDKAVRRGDAEHIDINHFDVDELIEKIIMLIQNPRYNESIAKTSRRMRGQPQKPIDRATFWIERVIEQQNFDHMRSPTHRQMFYNVFYLDLVAVLIAIAFVYVLIIWWHIAKRNDKTDKSTPIGNVTATLDNLAVKKAK